MINFDDLNDNESGLQVCPNCKTEYIWDWSQDIYVNWETKKHVQMVYNIFDCSDGVEEVGVTFCQHCNKLLCLTISDNNGCANYDHPEFMSLGTKIKQI